jgi:hypothetical protein
MIYDAIPMPTSTENTTANVTLYDLGEGVHIGRFTKNGNTAFLDRCKSE